MPRSRREVVDPAATWVRLGLPRRQLDDLYHWLLTRRWVTLFALLALGYVGTNALFALGYWLEPGSLENARPGSFWDAFFFSVQTMATIGYGKMVPRTPLANALVTLEALLGLLGFAMATGLIFAKFARPTARVLWSRVAAISPRDGVPSLMFRMANERGNWIADATLHVVLVRDERTLEGEPVRRFHDLALSRHRSATFALTWTAIHPITGASPLHGATPERLRDENAQIVVSLVGSDESFAQTIHARHVYGAGEVRFGERFVDIMGRLPDGRRSIDLGRFHDTEPAM